MSKEIVQGVTRFYGARDTDLMEAREYKSLGDEVVVEVDFDCTDLPVVADAVLIAKPGEQLTGARLEVLEPLDSAGNNATVTVGLRNVENTEIDDDGIDVTVAESALDTAGKVVVCDGAMVDNATGLGGEITANAFLYVTAANTPTAGKLRLRVTKNSNIA